MSTSGASIDFLGWVPKNRLAEIYSKVKFAVLPSFIEGFPLVLLESLACNAPFIACNDCEGLLKLIVKQKRAL